MNPSTQFAVQQTMQLLAIDSPTGFTKNATDYLLETLTNLGFSPIRTARAAYAAKSVARASLWCWLPMWIPWA